MPRSFRFDFRESPASDYVFCGHKEMRAAGERLVGTFGVKYLTPPMVGKLDPETGDITLEDGTVIPGSVQVDPASRRFCSCCGYEVISAEACGICGTVPGVL